jgi:hypothetical protein
VTEDRLEIGWHRDPDEPGRFRYWNGDDWTFRAGVHENGHIWAVGPLPRRGLIDSPLVRNPVSFHVLAWFDCSVPLIRGRLRRRFEPVELRTLDRIRGQL